MNTGRKGEEEICAQPCSTPPLPWCSIQGGYAAVPIASSLLCQHRLRASITVAAHGTINQICKLKKKKWLKLLPVSPDPISSNPCPSRVAPSSPPLTRPRLQSPLPVADFLKAIIMAAQQYHRLPSQPVVVFITQAITTNHPRHGYTKTAK
ncbi:hypothetical protein M0R45_006707 [Rubus argutus]|uniref:Uncharacterized protein n=1 Tax=Rubus argutus TaxID=59490 RepID=A0AAW1YS06_RUBAR